MISLTDGKKTTKTLSIYSDGVVEDDDASAYRRSVRLVSHYEAAYAVEHECGEEGRSRSDEITWRRRRQMKSSRCGPPWAYSLFRRLRPLGRLVYTPTDRRRWGLYCAIAAARTVKYHSQSGQTIAQGSRDRSPSKPLRRPYSKFVVWGGGCLPRIRYRHHPPLVRARGNADHESQAAPKANGLRSMNGQRKKPKRRGRRGGGGRV